MDIKELEQAVTDSLTSFSRVYVKGEGEIISIDDRDFAEPYYKALIKLKHEVSKLVSNAENEDHCYQRYKQIEVTEHGIEKDSFFYYGQLLDNLNNKTVERFAKGITQQVMIEKSENIDLTNKSLNNSHTIEQAKHLLSHISRVYANHLGFLMFEYEKILKEKTGSKDQTNYFTRVIFRKEDYHRDDELLKLEKWHDPEYLGKLMEDAQRNDNLSQYQRLNYSGGKFEVDRKPVHVKSLEEFFGYGRIKRELNLYFASFKSGNDVRPLLLQGPAGMGKTELTIAYSVKNRLPLVYGSKEDLEEGLENLLLKLSKRKKTRAVLFFDDIEAEKVDWNNFRFHISGVRYYPSNVAIVIATNDKFPDNVTSRGQNLMFDSFGDKLSQAIVKEALGKKYEDKVDTEVLAETIASEYNQSFSTKAPRTLIAYLKDLMLSKKKMQPLIQSAQVTAGVAQSTAQIAEELNADPEGNLEFEIDMSEFEK